jgi:hypothetical protein
MMLELFLLLILAILCINVVLLSSIPKIVRDTVKEEIRRLFEGE